MSALKKPQAEWLKGWHIDEATSQNDNVTVKDGAGKTVARIPFDHSPDPHDGERAYLIEAAPDMREALEGLFEHCSMIHSRWGENGNAHEANVAIARARAALAKSRNDVEDNAVRREWDAARYVESEDAAERNCRHDWVENEESGRTYCLTCGQDGDA